jgi:GNAT superfamily N-acetyltransferase
MSDFRLLAPINQCYYTSYEKDITTDWLLQVNYRLFRDTDGKLRLVYLNKLGGGYLGAVLLDKYSIVEQIYVLPSHRRIGIGSLLLTILEVEGIKPLLGQDFTPEGEVFFKRIGMLV